MRPYSMKSVGEFGGPGRDRTDDLFHAMEARSQLRHRPTYRHKKLEVGTTFILAQSVGIVNARRVGGSSHPRSRIARLRCATPPHPPVRVVPSSRGMHE